MVEHGLRGTGGPKISDEEFRLKFENADLRRLLIEAGLHSAEQDVAAKLHSLLMEELYHRVQNTLAVTQAIASQSISSAQSLKEAGDAIRHRLTALSSAHRLLLETSWGPTPLISIVKAAIEPFDVQDHGRFTIRIPDVEVTALAVQPLALMLNELCTNATKYGALSSATGTVSIVAEGDTAQQSLSLIWKEQGGPTVRAPTRRSFGSRLIEQSLFRDERAKLAFEPSGVVCTVQVPIASIEK
ncbi:HWE histidine kinase domain-containing protein [Hyphomicrobium sp. ghe19]|uniref:HWE histidine kinase domain-containing protein n=1 Tax=Hyphomicrobium sp. ghe19 TaxID=2682968 RepID=UPI00136737F8|nr:Blue-light-activated histidine kinase [Hyphomicrobium sp. ghe19]